MIRKIILFLICLIIVLLLVSLIQPIEIIGHTWKGVVDINFYGICINSDNQKPIDKFNIIWGMRTIPIKTDKGHFRFSQTIGTNTGKIYFKDLRIYSSLGDSSQFLNIIIKSEGFIDKEIFIPYSEVIVEKGNPLNISLEPIN